MKKILCLLLSVVIMLPFSVLCINAEDTLPESEHNYQNNFYGQWAYSGPEDALGLLVTFSEDTYVEHFYEYGIYVANSDNEITVGDVLNQIRRSGLGDYIDIFDSNNDLVGSYSGDELSGKTIFVSGNSFTITLTTDNSVTYYGFKVTDVTPCYSDDVSIINYHFNDENTVSKAYIKGTECALFSPDSIEGSITVGWATEAGGNAKYPCEGTLICDFDTLDLYSKTVTPALSTDEIFYFNNSDYYFDIDGENRYTMTSEDCKMLQRNLYKTFGPGPIPNPILSIVLATYPNWDWRGSCYGISAVTALQHYGLLDLASTQNVSSLSEMEIDEELISTINYYQANVASSFPVENKAFAPNTSSYRRQLKYLYESAEKGNISIFTFYEGLAWTTSGHAILITGAYTDIDGNHILIAYDCNSPYYYNNNFRSRLVISPDFKSITYGYHGEIGAFNWTDDFSQFKAFDINGETDTVSWYKALFKHLAELFRRLKDIFTQLFKIA